MPLCERLFSEAKALFLFDLRTELRISSCCKGLDISNDVGGVKGMEGRWRGERSQGRRTVAFISTLDAALHAVRLEPGTKRHVLYRASFLDGEVLRFGPELHGVVF